MTDLDFERAGLLQEVLRFLAQPRTIEEVAEEFGWHPQTAREKVWELRDMGKAKELTRKRGRAKVWQASSLTGKLGDAGYAVMTTGGTKPLSFYAINTHGQRRALGDIIGGALCYIWRRAYYQTQDQDDALNVARQGSLDPLLDIRRALEKIYLHQRDTIEALEKMLTDMPELWQDGNPALLEFFGKVSKQEMEDGVGDFEAWLLNFLSTYT